MLDGVVCCGPARVCWRTHSCIFTWDGVSLCFWFSERTLMANPDWRKPPYPIQTADYATYIQLISWFLDSPSPLCPFSVHRMALAGKDLGKEVGQWFGPSTAAGAIKYVIISPRLCPAPGPLPCNIGRLYTRSRRLGLGFHSPQILSSINPTCMLPLITPSGHPRGILGSRGVTEGY
jgi:hypothetical protein